MKPIVLGLLFALTITVINVGNGCAPAFQTLSSDNGSLASLSCVADEASLADIPEGELKTGYLGTRMIHYRDRGNGWIQIEGDTIIRVKGPVPTKPDFSAGRQGVGVQLSTSKWPGGRVPYVVHGSLNNDRRVQDAINHWNANLSGYIQFFPRGSETDFVSIVPASSGCQAVLGYYPGEGAHEVEISSACSAGNLVHELGHSLGLDHEQNRPDRDQFVTINWDKIQTAMRGMFSINANYRSYGEYDFGSIMHYSVTAFSVDQSHTITPKRAVPSGVIIGQRSGLSAGDIVAIREMYGPQGGGGGGSGTPLPPGEPLSQGLLVNYFRDTLFREFFTRERVAGVAANWGSAAPKDGMNADGYAVRWTGQIVPAKSARRQLVLRGTGEFRMRILDQTVINAQLFDSAGQAINGYEVSPDIDFVRGRAYPVVVEYVKRSPGSIAILNLSWREANGQEVAIPAVELSPEGLFSEQDGRLCTRN